MSAVKRCLITGVGGQDGSHLAEQLLAEDCEVWGLVRPTSGASLGHAAQAANAGLHILSGDVTDAASVRKAIRDVRPEEVYHLAAQSHVGTSFSDPEHTFRVNTEGTLHVLNAVKELYPRGRVYVAGTAELYGRSPPPHTEDSVWMPASPYAASKAAACHLARIYRASYGLHVTVGILGNHEGPRRGVRFVTKKVAMYAARLGAAPDKDAVPPLQLGNLDAAKDWGYAPDYTEAMQLILLADEPRDYIVSTGESNTVRDFVQAAFDVVGVKDWQSHVVVTPSEVRPWDTVPFTGQPTRIQTDLGWVAKTRFHALVRLMVEAEQAALKANSASATPVPVGRV